MNSIEGQKSETKAHCIIKNFLVLQGKLKATVLDDDFIQFAFMGDHDPEDEGTNQVEIQNEGQCTVDSNKVR